MLPFHPVHIYIWSVNPHFNSPYVFYLHIYWVMNINWHIFFFSSLLFFVNEFIGRACSLELRTLSCFSKVHDILRVDFVGYLFSFSWFVILFCWWFWLKKKSGKIISYDVSINDNFIMVVIGGDYYKWCDIFYDIIVIKIIIFVFRG